MFVCLTSRNSRVWGHLQGIYLLDDSFRSLFHVSNCD